MLEVSNISVVGWEPAIRGMRNPMNSWERSDSWFWDVFDEKEGDHFHNINGEETYLDLYEMSDDVEDIVDNYHVIVGTNDLDLMNRLFHGGTEHRKFMRMLVVYMDITAPLYWWKEFDTYKVGTVANSCSTMHKIHSRDLVIDDFSHDHLDEGGRDALNCIIENLNWYREKYLNTNDKDQWYNMIQLLPTNYNQKRTVMMNYEVASTIIRQRTGHKLDEWKVLVDALKDLPYLMDIML